MEIIELYKNGAGKKRCFNYCKIFKKKSKIKICLKIVKYENFSKYVTCKIENKEISPVAFAPGALCEINYI